ncbi:hypothetical protein OAL01_03365 [Rubripirellula sp.]|nr:hypothetical protein [Rubripirellula sp.]
MIRLFGFAFLLVLLAFNNQLNTRIGWSENYLTGSQWLVLIALIVVFTLTLALVGKAFDGAPNRRPIGWSTTLPLLLLVLIAFALLQLLPTVSTGIHLVPIVPWRFTSWTACSFSALLWFLLLCATTNLSGDSSNNISAVVSALLINSCLSFAEVSPNPAIDQTQSIIAASQSPSIAPLDLSTSKFEEVAINTADEYAEKVKSWHIKIEKIQQKIEQLFSDRQKLSADLKLVDNSDIELNAEVRSTLMVEQDELDEQIKRLLAEKILLTNSVLQIESSLRRIVRKGEVAETQGELDAGFEELAHTQRELGDFADYGRLSSEIDPAMPRFHD